MLNVIFTCDYEIHGNGEGSPRRLMVEPTGRMLELFDEYGAKLTIMADAAEILKFKEYADQAGRDDHQYGAIADQLRLAVRRGHDVQLHLHPSYFNAQYRNGRWEQDWSEYNFAELPFERMDQMVRKGRQYLENLLKPIRPTYDCHVFRAANWAVQPSGNIVRALLANGIRIDTSVFKYGRREGLVRFDYTHAPSALVPWRADEHDICRLQAGSRLLEVPIYCERRWIGAFASANRLYRAFLSRRHPLRHRQAAPAAARKSGASPGRRPGALWALFCRHAWKADFNQCSGRQLIGALQRAAARHNNASELPFVLIGHSKLFTRHNERTLRPLLSHISSHPGTFRFATFSSCSAQPAGLERYPLAEMAVPDAA